MINTLHIKNIGIIEDIEVNLNDGFNVITGETGAGKSLIMGSLQMLAGGRFSKEMIRKGEEKSLVEASFYFPQKGYEDDMVVVSREINVKGRNTCKINSRLVTVSELKEFMQNVINIHSQNENMTLLDANTYIELVDGYAIKDLEELKEKYTLLFNEYLEIKQELQKNYGDDRERQRKIDLLNYQINEIENASLKDGEEEELEERKIIMMSSEKISSNLDEASSSLNNNAIDSINHAVKCLEKIEEYNENYSEILKRLKNSYYEIQEVASDLNDYNEDMYFDEEELNHIEERLDLIHDCKRKYGNDIKEILEYKDSLNREVFEIENLEELISDLKSKKKKIELEMIEIANEMHEIRDNYSKELTILINDELKDLEMNNAVFKINVNKFDGKKFNRFGIDKVEFLISTNIGEDFKELNKVASGGEMSRIMLAIKSVLAEVDKIPVIIFDEIDTGISGTAANATGDKIKKISKNHQVICVTHLATIAAKGDYNYFVNKVVEDGQTKTKIKQLSEDEVLNEIARISSGKITKISINHAKELRNKKLKEIA